MERVYLLFAGDDYYPLGGMHDLKAQQGGLLFHTLKQAHAAIPRGCDWYQIVELTTEPVTLKIIDPPPWSHTIDDGADTFTS